MPLLEALELGAVGFPVGEDRHGEVLGDGAARFLSDLNEAAIGGDSVLLGLDDIIDDCENVRRARRARVELFEPLAQLLGVGQLLLSVRLEALLTFLGADAVEADRVDLVVDHGLGLVAAGIPQYLDDGYWA